MLPRQTKRTETGFAVGGVVEVSDVEVVAWERVLDAIVAVGLEIVYSMTAQVSFE